MSGSIGGVDASIPLQAGRGVQQPNPLAQIGQFAQTANALNNLKLFPGALQQQGIATQGQQLALQKAQNAAAYQVGLPVVANPNFTLDDLTGAWGSAEKNMGIATHQQVADIASLPQAPNTPEWRQAVKNIMVSRSQVDPGNAVGTITPSAGPIVQQGQVATPTTVSPAGSATPGVVSGAGEPFKLGLSPGEATAPTQVGVTPQGAPVMGTRQQFINKTGGGEPSPLGTGRPIPPALLGPNAPAAPAGGGVVTGLSPAATAAQSTTGGDSAHAFAAITNQGVAARSQGSVLDNMLADTSQFTTGPGADAIQKFREIGTRLGLPMDTTATSASESFNKLASQLADAQGAGSDARLAVNQAANPHSSLSPGGVDLILRQLRGNADYLQAQQHLAVGWQQAHPEDYQGFQDKVGTNLDPRAFQFARMTPQQKVDYAKTLSAPDLAKLKSAYNWSANNGLIGGADGGG